MQASFPVPFAVQSEPRGRNRQRAQQVTDSDQRTRDPFPAPGGALRAPLAVCVCGSMMARMAVGSMVISLG